MNYPKNISEMYKFAGTWTNAEMTFDLPDGTALIIGREDKIGDISRICFNCWRTTYFCWKDAAILKQAVAPVCSSCYLASLKEK